MGQIKPKNHLTLLSQESNGSLAGRYENPFDVPAHLAGGIDFLKSIPGLLKRVQIWALRSIDLSQPLGRPIIQTPYPLCSTPTTLMAEC
jgi:hypothetical protein